MKKFTKALSIAISIIMVFAIVGVAAACPKEDQTTKYVVKYMDGSTVLSSVTLNEGEKINKTNLIPNPLSTETGTKFFSHWSLEDGGVDFFASEAIANKDITLLPVYRNRAEGEIFVTFFSDGGSHVNPQILVGTGKTATVPARPTKSRYEFRFWAESSNLTAEYNFSQVVQADITLKAIWREVGSSNDTTIFTTNSGEYDGVFSPFFSSSAYDSSIHGQTQISMLSSNKAGEVYCGDDVPTVALDYSQKVYLDKQEIDPDKNAAAIGKISSEDKRNWDKLHTDYSFLIKNGIRFSDGTPLTIKDVIFNMYVYLDPLYTGSSTLYSTPIRGLQKFRQQDKDFVENSGSDNSFEETINNNVNNRMNKIAEYFIVSNDANARDNNRNAIAGSPEVEQQVFEDIYRLRQLFLEELKSDWAAVSGSNIEEDYEDYEFTEKWQAFLLNNGLVSIQWENDGTIKVDANGNKEISFEGRDAWFDDGDNLIKIVFNSTAGILTNSEAGNYIKGQPGEPVIDLIYDEDTGTYSDNKAVLPASYRKGIVTNDEDRTDDGTTFISRVLTKRIGGTFADNVTKLLYQRSCGGLLRQEIAAEERDKYFKDLGKDSKVYSIDGITVEKTTSFQGKLHPDDNTVLGEDHYVLKISINGVDPKAIWNFGFAVTPMHYYSNPDTDKLGDIKWPSDNIDNRFGTEDGYRAFNYPGVDGYTSTKEIHPGYVVADNTYMKNIINYPDVQKLPMGAGPFKATDSKSTKTVGGSGDERLRPTEFAADKVVYFMRNDYFETTGKGMSNPYIKLMRYQVIDTTKVLESLQKGEIVYADPSAKQQTIDIIDADPRLGKTKVMNNGYGYMGVNASKIPDIEIRQAIMTVMNTNLIYTYYSNGLAELIKRPISKASWAYPGDNVPEKYAYVASTVQTQIEELVAKAGFTGAERVDGAFTKRTDKGELRTLKFEFTIAGSSDDHPAMMMFQEGAKILNQCGFNVSVNPDALALSKLSSGSLAVWAAAWQSTIDPDMYQVYHEDSNAQSVNNWGYPYLLDPANDPNSGPLPEKATIKQLSKLIDEARESLENGKGGRRAQIYAQALDLVMDLAVEYPLYQRNNLYAYDITKIDASSLIPESECGPYQGPLDKIWLVKMR